MDHLQLELHDAQLLNVNLDPVTRLVELSLSYYPSEKAQERVPGVLRFAGVTHFNQIADFTQLENHARAGNVSYWITGETPGMSYIYLTRGVIAITAESVELTAGA